MDTPSDKLVIPLISPSALVNVAKMSMELFFEVGGGLLAVIVSCYLASRGSRFLDCGRSEITAVSSAT